MAGVQVEIVESKRSYRSFYSFKLYKYKYIYTHTHYILDWQYWRKDKMMDWKWWSIFGRSRYWSWWVQVQMKVWNILGINQGGWTKVRFSLS